MTMTQNCNFGGGIGEISSLNNGYRFDLRGEPWTASGQEVGWKGHINQCPFRSQDHKPSWRFLDSKVLQAHDGLINIMHMSPGLRVAMHNDSIDQPAAA